MNKLIDLTLEFSDLMPTYGGDETSRLFLTQHVDTDGYTLHKLETNLHVGTHIDVPMHLIQHDQYISEYALDNFIGRGCLLDVRGQSVITYQETYEEKVKASDIVILYTGHDQYFGKSEYYHQYPVVDEALAEFFIRKQIKMMCLDSPSPDRYPFNIHKLLFNKGIFIIEGLTKVGQLLEVENFEVIAFPLKLRAEASLIRVVARVLEG